MNTEKLTFTPGGGAYGLEDEYMADIVVGGIDKGIIACQAASKPVAESMRAWVISRLTCPPADQSDRIRELEAKLAAIRSSSSVCDRIDQLERENASLREENAVLVREEERLDAEVADLRRRSDASMGLARSLAETAPNWDLHGYHHPGSMDPGCSTIGIDSEGGSHD